MTPQPRGVDINTYYRTGGIDWTRCHANFDVVGIRACVGDSVDALLEEHVDNCKALGIPYFTYCVPDPSEDMTWQADFYLNQYGVMDGLACIDVEPTSGAMVNDYQGRKFTERVDSRHPGQCWYYSNHYYTSQIGYPSWIKTRPVFWAEYPYKFLTYLYRKFEPFLDKYPWWPPKWASRNGVTVTLHQFTKKGDARYYLANDKTGDNDWPDGIKSADLSVGLVDLVELLSLWDVFGDPPLSDKEKLDILWAHHPELHY